MDQNLEKFEVIRNIEKLYEEVFTRKGMGIFMNLHGIILKKTLSIFQELTIQNLKFILKMIKVLNLVQLIEKHQHYEFMKIF